MINDATVDDVGVLGLEGEAPEVIYILKVKCECIGRDLGVRAGVGVVKVEVRRRAG